MHIRHESDYRKKRKADYPTVGDQLDAIWKLLAKNPDALTPEAKGILDKITVVKSRYPKSQKQPR